MIRINIPCIAFGCLVKPVAAAFGAQLGCADAGVRGDFDSVFGYLTTARPQSRSLMEGPVDGNASFSASRYRCY
jgi:hypothetical protein